MSNVTRYLAQIGLNKHEVVLAADHEREMAALQAELHDAKTQWGKNAISHMREYHRVEELKATTRRFAEALISCRRGITPHITRNIEDGRRALEHDPDYQAAREWLEAHS